MENNIYKKNKNYLFKDKFNFEKDLNNKILELKNKLNFKKGDLVRSTIDDEEELGDGRIVQYFKNDVALFIEFTTNSMASVLYKNEIIFWSILFVEKVETKENKNG